MLFNLTTNAINVLLTKKPNATKITHRISSKQILFSSEIPVDALLTRWLINDKVEFLNRLPQRELIGLAMIGMRHNCNRDRSFNADLWAGLEYVQTVKNDPRFARLFKNITKNYDFYGGNYVKPMKLKEIADSIGFQAKNNHDLSFLSDIVTILKFGIGPHKFSQNTTHLMPVEVAIDTEIDMLNRKVTYKFKNKPDVVMEY